MLASVGKCTGTDEGALIGERSPAVSTIPPCCLSV